jgi:exosortase/archaeosortase family protein
MKILKRIEKKLTKKERRLLYILLFLLRFIIAAIPLYAIMIFNLDLYPLELPIAQQVSWILSLTGIKNHIDHGISPESGHVIPLLLVERISSPIGIDSACTGYRSMLAFLGLVLALPRVELKKRAKGLLFGLPTIYLINLARVFTTIWIAVRFGEELIEIVHTFLWREGLIFFLLLLWILWIKFVVKQIPLPK